jgi:hypothetical protein
VIWRTWCFIAALPLGALGAVAWRAEPELLDLEVAALASGALMLGLVSLAARLRDDDPERGRHLALGSSLGLVALPALGAALLGLAPGPRALFAVAVLVAVIGVLRGARVRGPSGGFALQLRFVLAILVVATLGVLGVAGLPAAWARSPAVPPARARLMYDHDARVALLPAPTCAPAASRVEVLLDHGAHPRLSRDGTTLWYDAAVDDGSRQVHSLERSTGVETCWTCGEAGHNLRPSPSTSGQAIVFDTDRYASWRHPANSELHLLTVSRRSKRARSRRLTRAPGRDDHGVFGPDSRLLVWSRGSGGRFAVVMAPIVTGHGGILLGPQADLFANGTAWSAPVAWSSDARALVVARGNPFEPLSAVLVDPATGAEIDGRVAVTGAAAVSFSADGSRFALASARRNHVAGLLPDRLGFALAPLARALHADETLHRDTTLFAGETGGAGTEIALREPGEWGTPTGVAIEPDGTGLVLGQRRRTDAGVEERMIAIALDCAS